MPGIYIAIASIGLYLLPSLPSTQAQWFVPDREPVPRSACSTPLNDRGSCVSLQMCPEVLEIYRKVSREQATAYSRELNRRCGNRNTYDNYPIVCCTHPKQTIPMTMMPTMTTTTTTPRSTTEWIDSILKINGEPCVGPAAETGFCKPLANCTELLTSLQQSPGNETMRAYIRASHDKCGFVSTDVCCPTRATSTRVPDPVSRDDSVVRELPSEEQGCGFSQQPLKKIINGEDSAPGAWPWAALLGYDIREAPTFRCGGTLITAKHVISAAHCLEDSLSFVRLGEFDLSTVTDGTHLDVSIAKVVGHPDFLSLRDKRHDIAILYLERKVQVSELITPICLPSKDLRSKSYVDHSPFVVGWGNTQVGGRSSDVLQQLQVYVYNNSICRNAYKQRSKFVRDSQFDETIICAGFLTGGKDSCQGDSGGPLMMPENYKGYVVRYYLIGVVSWGIGCGQIGVPGIYTSVQYFMDWIEQRVAES